MKKIVNHTAGTPLLEKVYRAGIHIPVGLINVFFFYVAPIYGVFFFVGFMIYELEESYMLKDGAYLDINGWLIGFSLGVSALFAYQTIFL